MAMSGQSPLLLSRQILALAGTRLYSHYQDRIPRDSAVIGPIPVVISACSNNKFSMELMAYYIPSLPNTYLPSYVSTDLGYTRGGMERDISLDWKHEQVHPRIRLSTLRTNLLQSTFFRTRLEINHTVAVEELLIAKFIDTDFPFMLLGEDFESEYMSELNLLSGPIPTVCIEDTVCRLVHQPTRYRKHTVYLYQDESIRKDFGNWTTSLGIRREKLKRRYDYEFTPIESRLFTVSYDTRIDYNRLTMSLTLFNPTNSTVYLSEGIILGYITRAL
ncbi:MAG: hypothetical protein HC888_19590 [Candidatus Competibacteraceae bacterium]|nr:hypothetical protein [Candidatus Competibacteraceae bacterium]